jgi:hypothetical protein
LKKIAILNQDSGYLMIDLANNFVEKGFDAAFVTGRLVTRSKNIHPKVKLFKIIKYNRSTTLLRLLTWIIGFFQIIYHVYFNLRKHHLLIVSNPPISFFITFLTPNNYSLLVYDVYPDVLAETGIISSKGKIYKLWVKANLVIYKKAENVFTLTQSMAKIVKKYRSNGKLQIVPIWTDNENLTYVPKIKNPFCLKHDLTDKFVVLYSGNLGSTSDIDVLLELALITKYKEIIFLIIGDGINKKNLIKKSQQLKLENCIFLPLQSTDTLKYSFSSADIAVVSLGNSVSNLGIPSKFFNYLSVGAPIMGIASKTSDLNNMISIHGVGACFEPQQKEEMISFIELNLKNKDIVLEYRKNATIASKLFSSDNSNNIVIEFDY